MPRISRALLALAGTCVLAFTGATTTASAAPAAVQASPPGGCLTFANSWGATCYEWAGDDQWVRDLDPNGYTTVVEVRTDYGKFRDCSAPAAADGWKECAFDHREGACVSFRMYEHKGSILGRSTAWTLWYSTTNGTECGYPV